MNRNSLALISTRQTVARPYRVAVSRHASASSCSVYTLGWVENARRITTPRRAAVAVGTDSTRNDRLQITATTGRRGVEILCDNRLLLAAPGLSALLVDDPYGPWGGHYEERASLELNTVRERRKVAAARVVESGPIRAALWCRLAGARSEIELTFFLGAADRHVTVDARVFFNERRARLKLALPGGDIADYVVPGGVIRRGPQGEVPGGRWLRVFDDRGRARFVFASDALYNFNTRAGCCYATVVRSARATLDRPEHAAQLPAEEPVLDRGEFQFRFLIGAGDRRSLNAAANFDQPPLIMPLPGTVARVPT